MHEKPDTVPDTIRILIIEPDGTARLEDVQPGLATMQRLVGGYIQGIAGDGWCGYCDEEGKLQGRPFNGAATMLAHLTGWPPDDVLVGSVVFLACDDAGEDQSVPVVVVDIARTLGIDVHESPLP